MFASYDDAKREYIFHSFQNADWNKSKNTRNMISKPITWAIFVNLDFHIFIKFPKMNLSTYVLEYI